MNASNSDESTGMFNRRSFLYGSAATVVASSAAGRAAMFGRGVEGSAGNLGMNFFVSPNGDDRNPGTIERPFHTFQAAQTAVRALRNHAPGAITVYFRSGTYYLDETVVLTPQDSGEQQAQVIYAPYPGEHVVLSGGLKLAPHWRPYRGGIMQTTVPPGTKTDQLFVNGRRQILARYPNFDPQARYLKGFSPDAISPERVRTWSNPKGGYIHALHQYLWGDMHYQISGKDAQGNLTYDGGWQNNRPRTMHEQYRFVEGIFEELDAPGEWFLDEAKNTLYFYPPAETDLDSAVVETVRLKHLIEFQGTESGPVRWITLKGFVFQHAARTFMDIREPLLRSDWRIYRGGAVFLNGTEDCNIDFCFFDQLGGNCIFVNHYNRRVRVSRSHIAEAGGNGICFVGDRHAVRNPLDNYDERLAVSELDLRPGPLTPNYPADCLVDDSLIYQTGRVEKQSAPIEISMSMSITVRHVSIYDVPRAGISIGDGCWGGHRIEYCDTFDTVKETGDHGSFNSWARDRWWEAKNVDLDTVVNGQYKNLPILDTILPNTLTNSRWRCDHGWDIDLDDGSTNYQITDNLCLNGGLKLREGFYRICENNVLINNSLHPHVWYLASHDIFRNNVVFTTYHPIRIRKWGQEFDYNLLHKPEAHDAKPATKLQAQSLQDLHSLIGDAQFIDPTTGDYRVKPGSPAIALGFLNFDMHQFGVQTPELKAIARQPELPKLSAVDATTGKTRSRAVATWAGARVRNIVGLDEVSASGTPGETGVILLEVPSDSPAAKAGFFAGDIILGLNGQSVKELQYLLEASQGEPAGKLSTVTILRFQQESTLTIRLR